MKPKQTRWVSNAEMSNFCPDQGRIRRRPQEGYGGTSKGWRCGVRLYAAAGHGERRSSEK